MESKICPNCNHIISYDSYFGKYVCRQCGYVDELSYSEKKLGDVAHSLASYSGASIGQAMECVRAFAESLEKNPEVNSMEYMWDGSGD